MGDCAYCGKRRINFNQDEDYTMRIENNDRGDYFIATGELMIDSIPISFCPFCRRDLTKKVDQYPFIPGKRMVDGYFHCSGCGWDGQIWEHIGFGDMLAYEAVHCPKCGAIIERRA